MDVLLNVVVCLGLFGVALCFFILMPAVGHLIGGLWATVMAEQALAKLRGKPSATDTDDVAVPAAGSEGTAAR